MIKKAVHFCLFKIINRFQNFILIQIKAWLNIYISNLTNDVIQDGIFKGQKLSNYSWWSNSDKANMLLGFYEQEVQNVILNNHKNFVNFVDIGAADGYYLFGLSELNYFQNYIAFEASEIGKSVIEKEIIKKGYNNIKCYGKADTNFVNQIDLTVKNLILCDIEGYEYEIFNEDNLKILNKNLIIIEIHSKNVQNFNHKYNSLLETASKFFNVAEIYTSSRDISKLNITNQLNDNQRWLLCSEGRSRLGTWLILNPKC
jgi:hypothetical protein